MKAKKVYEFINPKTDKYSLEDTLPLGPKFLERKRIEEWFEKWVPDVEYIIDNDLNIKIDSALDLMGSNTTWMPDNLFVKRWVDLKESNIIKLPDNLIIMGGLDIENTNIIELPDDLYIGWNFYLNFSKVTKLPNGLIIGGNLDIRNTEITEIPEDINVAGDVFKDF